MDAKALLWLYLVVALVVSIAASVADDDADDDDEGGEKAWKRFRERNGMIITNCRRTTVVILRTILRLTTVV